MRARGPFLQPEPGPTIACVATGGSISDTTSTQRASRPPVVLVGHSLGAAGVASSFVHNPEGVDGVVLVAPAIMVSPFSVSPKLRSRKIMCATVPCDTAMNETARALRCISCAC